MLELIHVGKRFGPDWAIVRFSLNVAPGELVWLEAPPGAGKSLLVRMALGLSVPTTGSVIVNGANPARMSYCARLKWRRGISAVLEDEPPLDLDAVSWVATGLAVKGDSWMLSVAQARAALEKFGLHGCSMRRFRELSSRTRFALSFARGLLRRPRLLLVDWPGCFPALLTREFRSELKKCLEEGCACLAVAAPEAPERDTDLAGRRVRLEAPPAEEK